MTDTAAASAAFAATWQKARSLATLAQTVATFFAAPAHSSRFREADIASSEAASAETLEAIEHALDEAAACLDLAADALETTEKL